MSDEAEELLIAWRTNHSPPDSEDWPKSFRELVRFADKLIAEREPKIMSVRERVNTLLGELFDESKVTRARISRIIEEDRANIADVIDRRLAGAFKAEPSDCCKGAVSHARRIVADTLKVQS